MVQDAGYYIAPVMVGGGGTFLSIIMVLIEAPM
jgi:hypothetical protein